MGRIRQHPGRYPQESPQPDRDSRDLGYNQLSDAFALLDFEGFCSVFNQNNFDLAAIIGVYRSGRVKNRDTLFPSKPAPGRT